MNLDYNIVYYAITFKSGVLVDIDILYLYSALQYKGHLGPLTCVAYIQLSLLSEAPFWDSSIWNIIK